MILRCPRAAGDAGIGAGTTIPTQTSVSWLNADKFLAGLKRINIFCGGFGAGKTEVAVNFSLHMRQLARRVSIADLDIVNLYFRSREVKEELRSRGIEVIVPGGALANADLPIILPEVRGALEDRGPKTGDRLPEEARGEGHSGACHQDTKTRRGQSSNDAPSDGGRGGQARMTIETRSPNEENGGDEGRGTKDGGTAPVVVLDLGGDPAGAKVMASIAEGMRPEDYSGLFVLNSRRPFTATVEAAKRMMDGISAAARINVDRIVVNSHLIDETTPAVIEEGIALGEEVARATGAAIAFVAVQRDMLERFDAEQCGHPVMVLDRLMLKPWEPSNWLGKYRIQ